MMSQLNSVKTRPVISSFKYSLSNIMFLECIYHSARGISCHPPLGVATPTWQYLNAIYNQMLSNCPQDRSMRDPSAVATWLLKVGLDLLLLFLLSALTCTAVCSSLDANGECDSQFSVMWLWKHASSFNFLQKLIHHRSFIR